MRFFFFNSKYIIQTFFFFVFKIYNKSRYSSLFLVNGFPFESKSLKILDKVSFLYSKFFLNFFSFAYILYWVPGFFSNYKKTLAFFNKIKKRYKKKKIFFFFMPKIPFLVFFFSSSFYFQNAIKEVNNLFIPSAGLVDSDSFFNKLNYPLFSNDDSLKTVFFLVEIITQCVLRGFFGNLFSEERVFKNLIEQKKFSRLNKQKLFFLSKLSRLQKKRNFEIKNFFFF